jgi:hypothetical protein
MGLDSISKVASLEDSDVIVFPIRRKAKRILRRSSWTWEETGGRNRSTGTFLSTDWRRNSPRRKCSACLACGSPTRLPDNTPISERSPAPPIAGCFPQSLPLPSALPFVAMHHVQPEVSEVRSDTEKADLELRNEAFVATIDREAEKKLVRKVRCGHNVE